MNLPDPAGRGPGSGRKEPLNTLEPSRITVLGYEMDLNIFTAICYLPLFPAVIIPCVIALNTTTDKPEDLRFAAVQSLILNGGFFALNAVLSGVMGVFAMIPLIGGLINFGLGIVMAVLIVAYILVSLKLVVSAYSGQKFAVPFIAPYAEKYSSPN